MNEYWASLGRIVFYWYCIRGNNELECHCMPLWGTVSHLFRPFECCPTGASAMTCMSGVEWISFEILSKCYRKCFDRNLCECYFHTHYSQTIRQFIAMFVYVFDDTFFSEQMFYCFIILLVFWYFSFSKHISSFHCSSFASLPLRCVAFGPTVEHMKRIEHSTEGLLSVVHTFICLFDDSKQIFNFFGSNSIKKYVLLLTFRMNFNEFVFTFRSAFVFYDSKSSI